MMNNLVLVIGLVVVSVLLVVNSDSDFGGEVYAVSGAIFVGCSDSDDFSAGTKGTVVYRNRAYEDRCRGKSAVREYYCDGDRRRAKTIRCDVGEACYDGACIPKSEVPPDCLDSDGLDFFVSGSVIYKGREYSDSCRSSSSRTFERRGDRVREHYCSNDRKRYVYEYCGGGVECVDGACVAEEVVVEEEEVVVEPVDYVVRDGYETYLVVTSAGLDGALVGLKNYRYSEYNIKTLFVSGLSKEQIKNRIVSEGSLAHVLLVGSSSTIPSVNDDDGFYADFNNDGVPEVSVGRIPSDDLDEVRNVVDKILAFEKAGFEKDILLLAASEATPVTGWKTATYYEENLMSLLSGWSVSKIYCKCGYPECGGFTEADVFDKVNEGQSIVVFKGHGGRCLSLAGCGGNLCYDDINKFSNERFPIFMSFSCRTINFDDPLYFSFKSLTLKDAGVVAYVGSNQDAGGFNTFIDLLFEEVNKADTLGEAVLNAKRKCYENVGEPYYCSQSLIRQVQLLGDPALRLK